MSLSLKDIVFVPSVQHTGTWFTIEFLQNFFPRTRELTFLLEPYDMKPSDANMLYQYVYTQPLDEPTITHVHLPIIKDLAHEVNFHGTWFEQTWIMNLATRRSLQVQTLLLFCNFFKTVIPVRDPLAAILTREARAPQFRHFFIVDGFVALATEFAKHPNVKFLPIDLPMSVEERAALLRDVAQHCGIDPNIHLPLLYKLASEWAAKNQTPGNKFKEPYEQRDLAKIKEMLGPKCAELEYLTNMSAVILPFMAGLGYTRRELRY